MKRPHLHIFQNRLHLMQFGSTQNFVIFKDWPGSSVRSDLPTFKFSPTPEGCNPSRLCLPESTGVDRCFTFSQVAMTSIKVPDPVMSLAVAPKSKDMAAAFGKALGRFQREVCKTQSRLYCRFLPLDCHAKCVHIKPAQMDKLSWNWYNDTHKQNRLFSWLPPKQPVSSQNSHGIHGGLAMDN